MRILVLVALALLAQPSGVAFRIADPELIPEGIAYDPVTKRFFVGSTFKRKIVAVDAAGRARDFVTEGRDGVYGFVGLRADAQRRTLWAISSNAGEGMPARGLDASCLGCSMVTVYDLAGGKLLRKYALPNTPAPHFLNDLTVLPNGDVYITDSQSGDLYRITREKNVLEKWVSLGAQAGPNGIDSTPDGRTLFVATGAGIRKVDVATGAVTAISRNLGTIDGLYFYFIANSQLQWFRGIYRPGGYDGSSLTPVAVLRRSLR